MHDTACDVWRLTMPAQLGQLSDWGLKVHTAIPIGATLRFKERSCFDEQLRHITANGGDRYLPLRVQTVVAGKEYSDSLLPVLRGHGSLILPSILGTRRQTNQYLPENGIILTQKKDNHQSVGSVIAYAQGAISPQKQRYRAQRYLTVVDLLDIYLLCAVSIGYCGLVRHLHRGLADYGRCCYLLNPLVTARKKVFIEIDDHHWFV